MMNFAVEGLVSNGSGSWRVELQLHHRGNDRRFVAVGEANDPREANRRAWRNAEEWVGDFIGALRPPPQDVL